MPNSSQPRKSGSRAGKDNGATSDKEEAATTESRRQSTGDVEIAPEGVAPDPAATLLAQASVKRESLLIKKRAPVPGRAPKPDRAAIAAQTLTEKTPEAPAETRAAATPARVEPKELETEPEVVSAPLPVRRAHESKERKKGLARVVGPATVVMAEQKPEQETEPAPAEKKGLWATLTRLRAGWGWVLALAALGVAFYGQKLVSDARVAGDPEPPTLSWVLFGVAGLLFVLGVTPWPAMATHKTTRFFASLRSMSRIRRWLFAGLAGSALVLGIASVPLFYVQSNALPEAEVNTGWLTNTGAWLMWIAAMLLFGAAWVVWERSVPPAIETDGQQALKDEQKGASGAEGVWRGGLSPRWHWAIIIGLFVLAMALRFPNLENAPPGLWFDEAEEGLLGQQLLQPDAVHHAFIGGYYTMGTIYLYVLGIIIKFLGAGIWQLRLLPAIGGSLTVPMLYVLGTRLYNWRVGLIAGGLLAASAWNITFSRLGMNSLPTIALDVGVYLCVMQGLRTGRFGYYAGAGVLMGLALQSYLASQVLPVVLAILFAYRLVTERMRFFRAVRAGVSVFVVSALLTFIPLGTFAIQHPDTFTSRASTVTIFSPTGSEGRSDALAESIRRHLDMFDYRGDSNPRHNLPGEPMLDWLTAALFFAGLATCVLRLWRWQYLFPVAWFVASISGGVLSLLFEAPQSHRTLENSVVTALVAAIFLGGVWSALDARIAAAWAWWRNRKRVGQTRAYSRLLYGGVAAAVIVVPVWSGAMNIDRYFNKQMNDMSVWLEMWGPNRAVGTLLSQFGDDYEVYISPDKVGTPTSMYLAPGKQPQVWPGGRILPFTDEKNVAVIFGGNDEADVLSIKRLYPNAQMQIIYGPNGQDPQLYSIVISPEDIRSVRGTETIDESHSAATLKINEYAPYKFGWQGAGAAPQITIDGNDVAAGESVSLAIGLHSVVLSGTQGTKVDFGSLLMGKGDSLMSPIASTMLFDPRKVEPHGLTAYLRQGDVFNTNPEIVRIDPQISFYFHVIPLNRPYTVEWVGKVYAPVDGVYTFYTEQLSRARLLIDSNEVLYNAQPNVVLSAQVNLTVGLHDIRIQYEDLDGFSHMYLYWTPPGMSDKYIIPQDFLLPVMGKYPDVPASGSWPSIDEADDTDWTRAGSAADLGQPQPPETPDQGESQPQPPPPTPVVAGDRLVPSLVLAGAGKMGLPRPRAAAMDTQGNFYIYSEDDSRIHKFGPDGTPITTWNVTGGDGAPLKEGSAMLVHDDKVLLLDSAAMSLITYSPDGEEEGRIHLCECYFPRGMALSNDGSLWVADTGFGHVLKVSFTGQTLLTLGENGTAPGQFVEPSSVWESPQGYLFVTDAGNKRVQSFTPDLKPLAQWPMGEGTARDGNRITGTPDGDALLTQYDGKAVIEYRTDGTEKNRWVFAPSGVPFIPAGIAPAADGEYIVLYPFDNAAAVFGLGK